MNKTLQLHINQHFRLSSKEVTYLLQNILKDQLAETGKSYKQLVLDLCDDKKPIPGDFLIGAIRLFLQIPLVTIKARMKEVIKVGRQKTKVWEAYDYYCIFGDENLEKSQFKIFLVFNGLKFYCPAVKTARAVVNKFVAPFMESLQETLDLSNNIYEMLPTSGVSSAFGLIISHLQAAHRLGSKADLATGTATITSEDIPTQPKSVTVASFS